MYTNVRFLHCIVSETVEKYTQKRMESLQKLVKNASVVCDVRLSKMSGHHHNSDNMYQAEVSMLVDGSEIFAFSEKEDLYKAVDDVRDELERILSSQKKKKMVMFRRGATHIKNALKHIQTYSGFRKKIVWGIIKI